MPAAANGSSALVTNAMRHECSGAEAGMTKSHDASRVVPGSIRAIMNAAGAIGVHEVDPGGFQVNGSLSSPMGNGGRPMEAGAKKTRTATFVTANGPLLCART